LYVSNVRGQAANFILVGGSFTRYYPAMEGWAEDDAKLGKTSMAVDRLAQRSHHVKNGKPPLLVLPDTATPPVGQKSPL
jgi:hypothetical protein